MESALRALVLADAGVQAEIGQRLHWQRIPQNPDAIYPAAIYDLVTARDELAHDGPRNMPEAIVQITTWARGLSEAKGAAETIRKAVNGFRGEYDGVWFESVFLEGWNHHWDPETGRAGLVQRFRVVYQEQE